MGVVVYFPGCKPVKRSNRGQKKQFQHIDNDVAEMKRAMIRGDSWNKRAWILQFLDHGGEIKHFTTSLIARSTLADANFVPTSPILADLRPFLSFDDDDLQPAS